MTATRVAYPDGMGEFVVRRGEMEDLRALAEMCRLLWPDHRAGGHAGSMRPILEGNPPGGTPAAIFVAEKSGHALIGFLEASLRSHADGCDPNQAVGYLEGWYVAAGFRNRGVGAQLVAAAEEWARKLGCREMASDTWIDAPGSQHAHEALGYEIVDRCVHYRKAL